MKTAYELLMTAPDEQVVRCQLAFKAIAAGNWTDAAHFLRNAAAHERGTEWCKGALELAAACERNEASSAQQ